MASDLVCIGLNHAQTPINIRERVAFPASQLQDALKQAVLEEHIEEAAILSTCNRIEIYAQGHSQYAEGSLKSFLHRFHAIPDNLLLPHLYHFQGEQALLQLFRVASSLDSLVIGEPQILGQVKSAYASAQESGTLGPQLNQAFSQAFLAAKRVRTETSLGKNAVTVAYAAVQLAEKVFGDLAGLKCLLLGSGEMGSLAATHFKQKNACIETACRNSNWLKSLEDSDLVLACTSSDQFLINPQNLKKMMRVRRYKPIFLIDIAVPRNIDPKVANIDNVYLYNIDDLVQVVSSNLEQRQKHAVMAEQIIQQEIEAYQVRKQERELGPLIQEFQAQNVLITEQELNKILQNYPWAEHQNKLLQNFAKQLSAKLLHQNILLLKNYLKCNTI